MNVKKATGFGLGLIGALLMWQTGVALAQYFHAHGTDPLIRLMFDPQYSLRMISAMAAFLAGLAALTERNGGAWLAGFASSLLLLETLALLGGHGSVFAWHSEAVYLIIMTSLFLSMVVAKTPREAPSQAAAA